MKILVWSTIRLVFLFYGFQTLMKRSNFSSCPKTDLKCIGGDTRIDFIQLFIQALYEL